jgi:long-subunit fatty acid transport protein
MTVKNNTTVDDLGLFPDGDESRADVPGILGIGVGYTDKKWEAQFSYNMYFDKYVDWGGNLRDISVWKDRDPSQIRAREIENNSFDIALGVQFNATEKFSVSGGVMYQKAGVADSYNSDFSFAPDSYVGLGGGIMWKITDQLALDAGVSLITYKDAEVSYFDPDINANYGESYGRESISFAVGLSYSIFR